MSNLVKIRRLNHVIVVLVIMALVLCAVNSSQASVVVDSSYFIGSRSTVGTSGSSGGLNWNPADGEWSGGNFSIAWNIINNGSDFTYSYTINTPSSGKAKLSHWILALSELNANGNNLESYWENVFVNKTTGNYTDTGIGNVPADNVGMSSGNSNNGMPNDFFSVKFKRDQEITQTTVTFTTPQVPIWGDFYARDGGGNGSGTIWAYNTGFGVDASSDTSGKYTNWIPRPDGKSIQTPEPATIIVWSLLAGLGLVFGWWRKRTG
jgi:hypothetical protein